MNSPITASMLYDSVQCPHRVFLDLFGDPDKRDPISAFVQLLWERGSAFEQETIEKLHVPFENLRVYSAEKKEQLTAEAMKRGDSLIYGGRIRIDNLLGEPDLLRREGTGYVAGDIKSGAGFEGMSEESGGKPKKHYAVQLGLYTSILDKLGLSTCSRVRRSVSLCKNNAMRINFNDIELAFEFVSSAPMTANVAVICKETGEIFYTSDYDDIDEIPEEVWDRDDCIEIPHKNDLDLGRNLVFEFVQTYLPGDFECIRQIFKRRRAYGRYKNFLEDRGFLKKWYDFENTRQTETLREWCEDNEINLID